MAEEIAKYIWLILVVYYFYRIFRDANKSINSWVEENKLEVLSKELRLFRTGPYSYWLRGNRPVYRMLVKYPNNEEKVCWIICNSLFGFNTKHFEVRCESKKKGKIKYSEKKINKD